MPESSTIRSIAIAFAIHIAIFAGLLLASPSDDKSVSASAQDPIMLMLGGTDPNKDAGLVGRERGVARGTKDGDPLFNPGKYTTEALEKIQRDAEKAQAAPPTPAQEVPKPAPKPSKPATKPAKKSTSSAPPQGQKTVSVADFIKSNKGKSAGKSSSSAKSSSGSGGSAKRIDDIRVGGGGSGKNAFGTATGTGGNGGDGGSRVADERAIYAEAVSARFRSFFEDVVAKEPVAISASVTVSARFSVDSNGIIKFIEVQGSSNPEITDRIKKAFARAFPSKFQRPPRGEGFTGKLENITFLVN